MPASFRLILPALLLILLAGSVAAGPGVHGVGPRVGVGLGPNQFVFGGQVDFGHLFYQTEWTLPFLEVGLGDGESLVTVGTSLLFRTAEERAGWSALLGGELALQFLSTDGEEHTDLGLSAVIGADRPIADGDRFGIQLKFGIIDSPGARFLAVWTFGN